MPLVEIISGEDTSRETRHRGLQLRADDPQAADHLRRGARASSSTGSSTRPPARSGAQQEEKGLSIKKIDEGVAGGERRADGAVLPDRPARPRHRPARRRAPARVLRRPLLRPQGDAEAGRRRASSAPSPEATASTRTASRRSRATREPNAEELADLFVLKSLGRGLHAARGGRLAPCARSTSG